jgi:MinD-like ATPase involved in chromosome partitioning or flagellar assembly
MFRAIVIAQDPEFGKAVERLAFESHHLVVNKTVGAFPENGYDVGRVISGYDPEIILVENTKVEACLQVAEKLKSYAPEVAVLALGGRVRMDLEQQFAALGVGLLNGAFSQQQFLAGIKSAVHYARQHSFGPMFAFLPGKAGSGATTVAFNIAAAIAISLQKKTFVLEADLHSGVMSTLLDTKPRLPLIDVLQNSNSLDYSSWLKYVISSGSTDFLLADRVKKSPLPSWMHYHQLLRFASSRYDATIIDLPEVVNEATEEIVQYAQWTFVVCTPELASLTLAEQRLQELKAHGAPPERLRVVLNRWHRNDMKPDEVAQLLGHPVSFVVKNDYRAISKAITSGKPVNVDCELGRSFVEFATKLVGAGNKENAAPAKARFSFF